VNIFAESENPEIFTCEFCGETVEIEAAVQ